MTETNTEKHTISVGTDTLGETVRFTAKRLGRAAVNGGPDGGGMDITFYRLPDDTYRALVEKEGISLLEPSNFVDVFGTDEPAEYGRCTLQEIKTQELYGDVFKALMEKHPEGRKRIVRDLN